MARFARRYKNQNVMLPQREFGVNIHSMLATFNLPEFAQWHTSISDFAGVSLPIVEPTPAQLAMLAQQLAASADTLRRVPIEQIVEALDRTAQRWQQPDFAPRQALLDLLPTINGYSRAMLEHVLDRMLADWRSDVLWRRLQSSFGEPRSLDDWQTSPVGMARVYGPRLTWHVCAGNVPGVALQSLVDALLVKSPSLIKVASGEPLWAAAFVATLIEELPALRSSLAVLWWRGGQHELEHALMPHIETVIANASNQAIADLRQRLPHHVRFIDYGARISFSVISREMLNGDDLPDLAHKLAYDVSMFDQRGCVSPQMIFVEHDDLQAIESFCMMLNHAMQTVDQQFPHQLNGEQRHAVRQLRDDVEWREMAGEPLTFWGDADGAWTIIYAKTADFAPTIGGRTIVVRPIADVAEIADLVAPLSSVLQSVAVAMPQERFFDFASQLAMLGVSRITNIGAQSFPNPLWHHDGRDPLGSLVRWSEIEMERDESRKQKAAG